MARLRCRRLLLRPPALALRCRTHRHHRATPRLPPPDPLTVGSRSPASTGRRAVSSRSRGAPGSPAAPAPPARLDPKRPPRDPEPAAGLRSAYGFRALTTLIKPKVGLIPTSRKPAPTSISESSRPEYCRPVVQPSMIML